MLMKLYSQSIITQLYTLLSGELILSHKCNLVLLISGVDLSPNMDDQTLFSTVKTVCCCCCFHASSVT